MSEFSRLGLYMFGYVCGSAITFVLMMSGMSLNDKKGEEEDVR